ncbi:MAG: hypothetical protein AB7V13_26090 [Pseudorhodoplanes sp.]|uniref:hypothetical protein n=1 Tax=Pseudorhodoplanes sp. TaxID=1934341 RepID=UPI003D0F92D3
MPRPFSAILLALAFLTVAAAPAPAQDKSTASMQGIWRFEKDAADAPNLSFVSDGKVIFLARTGRTISIWFAWPEGPQTKGAVRVRIDTGAKRWRLDGDLITEEQNGKPAIYFMQNDMGMSERKKKWGNLAQRYNQFIESLTAANQIVITTRQGVIRLPAVTIADARQMMQL